MIKLKRRNKARSPLNLVSSEEPLLPGDGQALQAGPSVEHLALLVVDGLRLRVALRDQSVGSLADLSNAILLSRHVLLELVKLPLENFDMFEVEPELLGRHESLLVVDPEEDLVALSQELNQDLFGKQRHVRPVIQAGQEAKA